MATDWKSGRLEAGKLRHRIDIVKVNPTQDSTGGLDWSVDTVFANVWASVEALDGTETMSGQSEMSQVSWQVLIRYLPNALAPYTAVTAAMQVWWQGRQFQIKSVLNPDGRNKMLALMCVEINDSRQQITTQPADLN